jgi:group I intron endonuclease
MKEIENKECAITGDILNQREKRLERGIVETKKLQGIYLIVNYVNRKFYVGSSTNIYKRWNNHIRRFETNKHGNKHLQSAWKKYGSANFYFFIAEVVGGNISNLLKKEQEYLDKYFGNIFCYNKSSIAFMDSEQVRNKISNSLKNKTHSQETKDKISRGLSGRKWSKSEFDKNSYNVKLKNIITNETKEFYSLKEAERKMGVKGAALKAIASKNSKRLMYDKQWIIIELNGKPFEKKNWLERRGFQYIFRNIHTNETKVYLSIRKAQKELGSRDLYDVVKRKKTQSSNGWSLN